MCSLVSAVIGDVFVVTPSDVRRRSDSLFCGAAVESGVHHIVVCVRISVGVFKFENLLMLP